MCFSTVSKLVAGRLTKMRGIADFAKSFPCADGPCQLQTANYKVFAPHREEKFGALVSESHLGGVRIVPTRFQQQKQATLQVGEW